MTQARFPDSRYDDLYGQALRWIRLTRRLSQIEMAHLVGVSLRAYVGWERGEHPPNLASQAKIDAVLTDEERDVTQRFIAEAMSK